MHGLILGAAGMIGRKLTERLRKDGTRIDVSLDLAPIGDKHGSIIGMSTIAHDITEKKAAEKKATEQAAHQDAQVEQVGMDMQYNIPEK